MNVVSDGITSLKKSTSGCPQNAMLLVHREALSSQTQFPGVGKLYVFILLCLVFNFVNQNILGYDLF